MLSRRLLVNHIRHPFGPRRGLSKSYSATAPSTHPVCRGALNPDVLVGVGLSAEDAHQVLVACPRLNTTASEGLLTNNVNFLRTIYKPHLVAKLLRRRPEVFTAQLEEWHQFLTGYGLDDEDVWRVLRYSPGLLLRQRRGDGDGNVARGSSTGGASAGGRSAVQTDITDVDGAAAVPNTPYNAGAVIMWLKSYGWTDEEVTERLLRCYPEVLAASPEQLQAAVEFLKSRNFDEEAIARMVRVFPPLLVAPYNEPLLALIDRIRASAHNKYVVSGSYHV